MKHKFLEHILATDLEAVFQKLDFLSNFHILLQMFLFQIQQYLPQGQGPCISSIK